MDFEVIGWIHDVQTIAVGRAIRQLGRLRRRHGIGRRELKIKFPLLDSRMRKLVRPQIRFAVCINNQGYEASLEVGKLYRIVPDAEATRHGYVRIIDESGEDYGYSADRFFPIDVPRPLERVLLKAAS